MTKPQIQAIHGMNTARLLDDVELRSLVYSIIDVLDLTIVRRPSVNDRGEWADLSWPLRIMAPVIASEQIAFSAAVRHRHWWQRRK